jgi:predicted GNAT family acetyltransferase
MSDKKLVQDFCYQRERENLFVIGSFNRYKNTFEENDFWGYFLENELVGLATYFRLHKNFVINALDLNVIEELVDEGIKNEITIEGVVAFRKQTEPVMNRLKNIYNIIPKKISQQTVYTLEKQNFQDFSKGEESLAKKNDIDEIAYLHLGKNRETLTDEDRKRVSIQTEFILKKQGVIVSKANIHGVSKHYFQIGGVVTRESAQGKGYAKQVVSFLCKHYFSQGIQYGLLFTGDDNIAAQKVYASIGFKPVDEFLIVEYIQNRF